MNILRRFRFPHYLHHQRASTSKTLHIEPTLWPNERHHACSVLDNTNLEYTLWLEDLLVLYGSNTVVFDLNILVNDPEVAVRALIKEDYQPTDPHDGFCFMPSEFRGPRLRHPQKSTFVTLLSTTSWRYQSPLQHVPPLSDFLDTVMDIWLHIAPAEYGAQLEFALHLFCWIGYCYDLKDVDGIEVRAVEYAECLRPEHRELHYDIVEQPYPKKKSPASNDRHRYHVRRSHEIKSGHFIPRPYDKNLFQHQLPSVSE